MDHSKCLVIVSDIHANLVALERVLEKLRLMGADNMKKWLCLGDVIGYGPQPKECIKIAKGWPIVVQGNHEGYMDYSYSKKNLNPSARNAASWTYHHLTTEEREWCLELPKVKQVKLPTDMIIELRHYAPNSKAGYVYNRDEAEKAFADLPAEVKLVFVGHTHKPVMMEKKKNGKCTYTPSEEFKDYFGWDTPLTLDRNSQYIINVGSVGQPRDEDVRASLVLYDVKEHEVKFVRVDYDIDKVVKMIEDNEKLPDSLGKRLLLGK